MSSCLDTEKCLPGEFSREHFPLPRGQRALLSLPDGGHEITVSYIIHSTNTELPEPGSELSFEGTEMDRCCLCLEVMHGPQRERA